MQDTMINIGPIPMRIVKGQIWKDQYGKYYIIHSISVEKELVVLLQHYDFDTKTVVTPDKIAAEKIGNFLSVCCAGTITDAAGNFIQAVRTASYTFESHS